MTELSGKCCSVCKQEKTFAEFGRRKAMSDGHRSECKACMAAATKARRERDPEAQKERERRFYREHRAERIATAKAYRIANPERAKAASLRSARVTGWHMQLAARAKAVAKKRGWDFDLDGDFVLSLFEKQAGRCYWLGIELVPSIEKRNPQQPSLDRVDPDKGYTKDNVVLASQFANLGRSEMSAQRFTDFVAQLETHFTSRTNRQVA